jgi:uncharacterized LabA/DUF88 family protein
MISDDLRRQADHFLDLADLTERIGRSSADRPARRDEYDDDGYDDYDE